MDTRAPGIDPQQFRTVLGHVPTGVSVVAGLTHDGTPNGLAVGSFSSVSLEPALVAFLVADTSTSWPTLRSSRAFCVSVLSDDQDAVCASLARKGGDKFADVAWSPSPVNGAPRVTGSHAWIDCCLVDEVTLGDHVLVVGQVLALEAPGTSAPLVFYRGGYHRVDAISSAA